MEIKKSSKADLEKGKSLNYLMGIVIALAVLFVGFEWGNPEISVTADSGFAYDVPNEEIAPSEQELLKPPPIVVEIPKDLEIINIVDDSFSVETILFSSDDDPTQAQVITYVAPLGVVEADEVPDEEVIFPFVEKSPEFLHGSLLAWIKNNINYPAVAIENGISGRVYCEFVVNADGSVSDVTVIRGKDPILDREAIRVLRLLPKFKPGEQRGKPVRVKFSVPVVFQLEER